MILDGDVGGVHSSATQSSGGDKEHVILGGSDGVGAGGAILPWLQEVVFSLMEL